MEQSAALINTLTVPSLDRTRVAAALHQHSFEHFTGIHVLINAGIPSAAFALYRPQLEAYVRGAWYHRCATDEQIAQFLAGAEPPSPGAQIEALEAMGLFDTDSLSKLKKTTWRNLCDFTHGGAIQVKARAASPNEIAQNYKVEHIAGILTASATTSYLAALGLAAVAGNDAIALRLKEAFNAIYQQAA